MGYRFSLVLSREISDEESAVLRNAGCTSAVFGTDTLPTNAEVTVTKMDFDDTDSPSLAEAIESALEAVKKVPELTVPGLTVPAQPAHAPEAADAGVVEGTVVTDEPAGTAVTAGDGTAPEEAKTASGGKTAAKKPRAKKAAAAKAEAEDRKSAEVGAAG